MSGPQLAHVVYVIDDADTAHVFGPGDDVPDWARAKIRNPAAWADEDTSTAQGPASDAPADETPGGPDAGQTPPPTAPPPAPDATPGPPPRTGRGSGQVAWAAYAEANGVTVDPADGRDEIIAALEAAEVRTS